MKHLLILCIIFSLSSLIKITGQDDCKVLLETIADSYEGECKKGLAHGDGLAKGIDSYKGKFKKGLPHGTGVYTWANGEIYIGSFKEGKRNGSGKLKIADGTIVSEGIWKDDKFLKKKKVAEYKILTQRNVLSVSMIKVGTGSNRIEISLSRDGYESTKRVDGLMIVTSSGVEMDNNNSIVYYDANFPFDANIRFKFPGRFAPTEVVEALVEFQILEQGEWQVRIKY